MLISLFYPDVIHLEKGVLCNELMKMIGTKRWFSIEPKFFEILVGGIGGSLKGYLTERRKEAVTWIRFGEEGLGMLLKCIVQCCREGGNTKRFFEWKEKGNYYRVVNNRNEVGKYLMCSVTDGASKKHNLYTIRED